jgi:hypothetical protein
MLLISCQSQDKKIAIPPIEIWNETKLTKLMYSRVFIVNKESDKVQIRDFLSTAQPTNLDIYDSSNPFVFEIQIQYGTNNEEQYWRVHEVNGEYFLKDAIGNTWKTNGEFFMMLEKLYN